MLELVISATMRQCIPLAPTQSARPHSQTDKNGSRRRAFFLKVSEAPLVNRDDFLHFKQWFHPKRDEHESVFQTLFLLGVLCRRIRLRNLLILVCIFLFPLLQYSEDFPSQINGNRNILKVTDSH